VRRRAKYDREAYYRGVRMVPYDLIKELAVALAVTTVLVIGMAAILSSPDVPVLTVQTWSRADPVDFVTTSTNELAGTTTSAQYGPPYNNGTNSVQHLWFLHPQEWAGVHQPVDPANDFVLRPLQQSTVGDKSLSDALNTYQGATADQQSTWLTNYTTALGNATVDDNGNVTVANGDYGPLPVMMGTLLGLARSGGLDGLLLQSDRFYQTDYTRPLLFLGDSGQIAALAQQQNLTGNQWGVMNETGRYPGQAWLWLYTVWYQVGPFNQQSGFLGVNSANADLAVVFTMGVLTLALLLLPFIPGLRDIPRWIPVHRLIWRRYYAEEARAAMK
jgi:hypothetical protein